MTNQEKDNIREALRLYVDRYPSQNKAAASLNGISTGTMSTVLNGKYESVSDEMFQNIASQVGAGIKKGWQIVETTSFKEIEMQVSIARDEKWMQWIIGNSGCGKTTAASIISKEHPETFYVLCSEDMRKGDFLREFAHQVGIKTNGVKGLLELKKEICRALVQMAAPLIIFDEADKLQENVFSYLLDIENHTKGCCGIVCLSTSYIKRRIEFGLRYNKRGYAELNSRLGSKPYELEETSYQDSYAICSHNGLNGKALKEALVDAAKYDFDLRRVYRAVVRVKKMGLTE